VPLLSGAREWLLRSHFDERPLLGGRVHAGHAGCSAALGAVHSQVHGARFFGDRFALEDATPSVHSAWRGKIQGQLLAIGLHSRIPLLPMHARFKRVGVGTNGMPLRVHFLTIASINSIRCLHKFHHNTEGRLGVDDNDTYGARLSTGVYTRGVPLKIFTPLLRLKRAGLRCSLLLPVGTVNCVQTLKVHGRHVRIQC
jgi:hypothetical protein